MPMTHRPATELDTQEICGCAQDAQELFFFFPKAQFPLTPQQLNQAVAERADATVAVLNGQVVAFANFYRWERSRPAALSQTGIRASCRRGACRPARQSGSAHPYAPVERRGRRMRAQLSYILQKFAF